jgi:hypothetical protein
MPTIIRDEDNAKLSGFRICRNSLIEELGDPLKLNFELNDDNESKLIEWIEKDYNIERWGFEEVRHKFVKAYTYHTSQEEHSINGEIGFTIYCRQGFGDAFWSQDPYIVVDGELYFVADGALAETEFLSWDLGWYLKLIGEPLRYTKEGRSFRKTLDDINEKLSPGYSGSNLYLLERLFYKNTQPVWSEKLGCHVGKIILRDPTGAPPFDPAGAGYSTAVVEIRPSLL